MSGRNYSKSSLLMDASLQKHGILRKFGIRRKHGSQRSSTGGTDRVGIARPMPQTQKIKEDYYEH